jgi:guanylate kinase
MSPKTPNKKPGTLIILSGPSGVGKTTLRKQLQKTMPALHFSVSWTTRPPRFGEKLGQDYRFVSLPRFEKKRAEGAFLEWAKVHEAYYGTPLLPIQQWLRKGEDVLLDIDIQGARTVKKKIPQAIAIFILPPSSSVLKERLLDRRTDSPATIRVRLKNAEKELQAVRNFDYSVVNQELSEAVESLKTIIKAARFRVIKAWPKIFENPVSRRQNLSAGGKIGPYWIMARNLSKPTRHPRP